MTRRVTVEDGHAVIRVPLDEVHSLRVALDDCPCKSTKSHATTNIRKSLQRALAAVIQPTR